MKDIGFVRSNFKDHADPLEMQKYESQIVISDEYIEGLKEIEKNGYLQVLYKFHLYEDDFELKDNTYAGDLRGIFASRCTKRPNNIGLTTVKLMERTGKILKVLGLDAIDGSPVLDIKPYNSVLDLGAY
ncbi:MAG: tRNA (N6-threonylcarbamoyladenosine(37)-N6)-methyltransferase TrmO [Promethearchaeota archaeon]|nr:MAG: tRNA (N6-threonylcarbamoyladenosine(37)-N6)-methyltransferase TrmO [Candidatus Lokiarchaeota archaeon]